jgi:hypothetical membrane protein
VTTTSIGGTRTDLARGSAAPMPSRVAVVLGGGAWIIATLQFGVAQAIVATAWNPPYNWLTNYISDLGNTACGQFAVPHGTPAYVCSPLHAVMNASFMLAGALTIAGAVLLRRIWPPRLLTSVALVLWVSSGLGKIVVGLYPENTNVELHLIGALNVPVGSIAILLLSLALLGANRRLGIVGILLAALGLLGTVLSIAGQIAGPALYFGLGVGGMERVSDYPGSLAMLLLGLVAVLSLTGSQGKARG